MSDNRVVGLPLSNEERTVPRTEIVGRHEVLPVKDSARSERSTKPASLLNPLDYPVVAVCAPCGHPVRAETLYSDWEHAGEPVASRLRPAVG
jgi:hypothetical protein